MNKILSVCLLGFALFSCSFAGNSQEVLHKGGLGGNTDLTDTSEVNDSILKQQRLTLNDPKKDFKDLFENSSISSAVNKAGLNPKAFSFVQDYMHKHSKSLIYMKDHAMPYFDLMEGILKKHGLPVELKYLTVIESQLHTHAVSWAGAVGPWQFMSSTARKMGLRIGKKIDERTDYYKSTHAAARYLTELYGIYGDWLLVIAAYNGGPGNVNSAIRRSGSKDFWRLQNYLPTETRNHVKKFIATHYILEGQGGLTTLTKEETKNYIFPVIEITASNSDITVEGVSNIKTVTISGKYNSGIIVKNILMDIVEFNKLNPGFNTIIANTGNYDLRLSSDKMDLFLANKFKILNESIQFLLNAANSAAYKQRELM